MSYRTPDKQVVGHLEARPRRPPSLLLQALHLRPDVVLVMKEQDAREREQGLGEHEQVPSQRRR